MTTIEEIKDKIESYKKDVPSYYDPNQSQKGAMIGELNRACRSNDNRKLFLKELFGVTSSSLLSVSDWWALKQFIDSRKIGEVWVVREGFAAEVGVVMAAVVKQEGQLEIFAETNQKDE